MVPGVSGWKTFFFTLTGTISYAREYIIVYRYDYLGYDKNLYNQWD